MPHRPAVDVHDQRMRVRSGRGSEESLDLQSVGSRPDDRRRADIASDMKRVPAWAVEAITRTPSPVCHDDLGRTR